MIFFTGSCHAFTFYFGLNVFFIERPYQMNLVPTVYLIKQQVLIHFNFSSFREFFVVLKSILKGISQHKHMNIC